MTNKNNDKYVFIKAATPISLKLQFRVLCTRKQLTMSKVVEKLIEKWIQANTPTFDFSIESSEQKNEDLKVYIPEGLKTQFKVLCIQNKVTMRSTLSNLIHQWVEAESD